ncbi:MAG: N-succinylarginine dihydrolase [Euryhalocaulis sp.]|uniref:N-succinylarginine dihydrolase n=1 Tax=Euryhalocaulis sp. TaxID=2744307 RepID=UPI001844C769|nr:N-succinylarginine dihydrolase [Euryhalocaulis sp.]MBA4802823.1 N-succinylarginine dihydrolase [Euryhalocaulis sp.]
MSAVEANYDGLIGPTHNYGGLSVGNVASAANRGAVSHPREAALQGLEKMKLLQSAGRIQGVLPPHERPAIWRLRQLGFTGSDEQVLEKAWKEAPALVRRASSASAMWTANAATVSPSADTSDGRLHMSVANLVSMPHRALEAEQTARSLRAAFPGDEHFAIHDALPMQGDFADEGAANHVRLCAEQGAPGVEIFVYGRSAFDEAPRAKFPARQTLEACQALARRAGLDPARTVYIRQSHEAIDAGAFHNDVVCVGMERCLFFHEKAFDDKEKAMADIRRAAEGLFEPEFIEAPEAEIPIGDAISSYLFNSQLLRWPNESRLFLLTPAETEETPATYKYVDQLLKRNTAIGRWTVVDVRQSMRNGGGPACLRLRVVLNEDEQAAANPSMILDHARYDVLRRWIEKHYREDLADNELGDPALLNESRTALDELTGILGLGADFYPFQRG